MDDRDQLTASRDLDRARAVARVLDTAVGIPGTPIRVGLDAIIGLIPGAGDAIGAVLSGYIVLAAARQGAPRAVLLRMVGNIAVDALVGSVPVLGDLFDVAFKANTRNVHLLEQVSVAPRRVDRRSKQLGVLVVVALALVVIGLATLGFLVARLLWTALSGA